MSRHNNLKYALRFQVYASPLVDQSPLLLKLFPLYRQIKHNPDSNVSFPSSMFIVHMGLVCDSIDS
jgi:hypothetical protein